MESLTNLQISYSYRKQSHIWGAAILSLAAMFLIAGVISEVYRGEILGFGFGFEAGSSFTLVGILSFILKKIAEVRDSKSLFARLEPTFVYVSAVASILGFLLFSYSLCQLLSDHVSLDYARYAAYGQTFLGVLERSLSPDLMSLIPILQSINSMLDGIGTFLRIEETGSEASWIIFVAKTAPVILLVVFFGFIAGRNTNVNLVGLHRIYRDLLMHTFMPTSIGNDIHLNVGAKDANEFFVHELKETTQKPIEGVRRAPYHIINTNFVISRSRDARFVGRGGASFVLSPLFSGSSATGWRRSDQWEPSSTHMTLATAMATSGAAFNPRTGPGGKGPARTPLVSFLMTLFNARLGLWVQNPRYSAGEEDRRTIRKVGDRLTEKSRRTPKRDPDFILPGLRGILGRLSATYGDEFTRFIELTDGAHFDNTGLYELIRRKVRLIFMVDCSEDKDFNYASLATAFERIRADFAVQFRFSEIDKGLEDLLHDPEGQNAWAKKLEIAERGYALARIDYQPHQDHHTGDEDGLLVIIKSTMIKDVPADVLGYKSANSDFPDESTMDQFFDEIQFEAYRELGYRIAKKAFEDPKIRKVHAFCVPDESPQWGEYDV